jgi:hypothetical protein
VKYVCGREFVCVFERDREKERESAREREREYVLVWVWLSVCVCVLVVMCVCVLPHACAWCVNERMRAWGACFERMRLIS